jgi:hypothetical protein
VEAQLLDSAAWGDGPRNDKAVAFAGKSASLQLPAGLFGDLDDFSVSPCKLAALGPLRVPRGPGRVLLHVHPIQNRAGGAAFRDLRRDTQRRADRQSALGHADRGQLGDASCDGRMQVFHVHAGALSAVEIAALMR